WSLVLSLSACFLYVYRHDLDLHSFPTRRSSDLAAGALERSAQEHVELLELIVAGDIARAGALMRQHIGHVRGVWAGRPESDDGKDRKSTRLNSSHVSISYAVFCLKKKKTK